MLRRSLAVLALAGALAAVAAEASPAAFVRVEGKTQTIFGGSEPAVDAATPLQALEAASVLGEFYFHVQLTSFGPYVDQIGRNLASGSAGWVFKVNGASPPVGADQLRLNPNDRVLWYWAEFGPSGGPPTLRLQRSGRCFTSAAVDDTGRASPATDVTYLVDGRARGATSGRFCPAGHWHKVRAVKAGLVRSQVVYR